MQGTYRGAVEICGTTHKTVRRIIAAHVAASSGATWSGGAGSGMVGRWPTAARTALLWTDPHGLRYLRTPDGTTSVT